MQEKLDKLFTWGSAKFFPKWCQSEEHWTAKLAVFLFVDCACCLMFRGIVIGVLFGSMINWALFALL